MNTKASKWGARQHRIQLFLPVEVQETLNRYIAETYTPGARMVTATIARALSEFLEREGYPSREQVSSQGGDKM